MVRHPQGPYPAAKASGCPGPEHHKRKDVAEELIALETTARACRGWQPSLPGEEKPSGLVLAWDGDSSQGIHKYQRDTLPQIHVRS